MRNLINEIINPENNLEKEIVNDIEFIKGVSYGKPRDGHPEGKVIYHIGEVLANVEKYYSVYRSDLRIISIIHDSLKFKVSRKIPRSGENHHAMIARRFAEKFPIESNILTIIELHDEAYNSWLHGSRYGKWDKAETRARKLIKRLGDENCLSTYLMFLHCDGETGDKVGGTYEWFVNLINS